VHFIDKFLTVFLEVLAMQHEATGSDLRDSKGRLDKEDLYM